MANKITIQRKVKVVTEQHNMYVPSSTGSRSSSGASQSALTPLPSPQSLHLSQEPFSLGLYLCVSRSDKPAVMEELPDEGVDC